MLHETVQTPEQKQAYTNQIELEKLFNKNQLIPRIKKEFAESKDPNFIQHLETCGIPIPFGLDMLAQMALHKRAKLPTMIGLLRHHFNNAQLVADMLLKCAAANLIDWNGTYEQFIVRFTISADVQTELDRFQYPLPMIVEPRPVRTNKDSGYLSGGGSLILRDNHHNDDICLDHINRLNRMKFRVDSEVATMVKNEWRGLDRIQPGETKDDLEKRQRAFEKYDAHSRAVIKLLEEVSDGTFHLTHKYDKRGRTYCQGYHVNYQGAPWNKAVIHLADAELVE